MVLLIDIAMVIARQKLAYRTDSKSVVLLLLAPQKFINFKIHHQISNNIHTFVWFECAFVLFKMRFILSKRILSNYKKGSKWALWILVQNNVLEICFVHYKPQLL